MWSSSSELGRTTTQHLRTRVDICVARRLSSCSSYAAASGRLPHIETHRAGTSIINQNLMMQKKWITMQHIRRTGEAKEQWKMWAKEIRAGKRKSFLEHLEERELVYQVVGNRDLLNQIFINKRVGMYAGVDPTAPSLHIGHMLPFMVLAWGYAWGLPVTFLLGGSTARFGDPTGRMTSRDPVKSSIRKANIASMHIQLKRLGACIEKYANRHGYAHEWAWKRALTNNNVWWNKTPFPDVMRDMGSYIRLGPMLGRDTVKSRLDSGDGMSLSEFTYPLMQAWDWWMLFQKGTQVQVGGSDQFGNILFGIDAVKHAARNTAVELVRQPLENETDKPIGLTTPLLTAASGKKFGKSVGNAIWLDKDMTSTFELYQFFVRTTDADVERYLKMLTFLPLPEIARIMEEQQKDPSKRVAQHALAREFLELVHGSLEAEAAALQHRQLFRSRSSTGEPSPAPVKAPNIPDNYAHRPEAQFANKAAGNKFAPAVNFANMPNIRVTLPRSMITTQPFHKVLYAAGLVTSNNEGHRLIANGGAHIGHRPGYTGEMSDAMAFSPIRPWPPQRNDEFIIDGSLLILRIGKWKYKMVNIVSDEEFDEQGLSAPGWEECKQAIRDTQKEKKQFHQSVQVRKVESKSE